MLPTRSAPTPACPARVRVASLTALLAAGLWSLAVSAAPLAPDPVELFRQTLVQERPVNPTPEYIAQRRRALEEAARNVRSLGDMSRVLLLSEWRVTQLNPAEADLDRQVRESIIEKFEQGLRNIMRRGDTVQRIAAANLIGETVGGARRQDIETVQGAAEVGKKGATPSFRYLRLRLKTMVSDLDRLGRDPSSDVRIAAARSLGNLEGNPREAAPALQRLLHDREPAVRRAAAQALATALQTVIQLNNDRLGQQSAFEDLEEFPENTSEQERVLLRMRAIARLEPLRSVIQYIPVATEGLEDSDAGVRRACIEACRKGSSTLVSLTALTILPPENEMPPKGFPLSPDDRARVLLQRATVHAMLEGLTPALRTFRNQAPLWSRVATDSDADVRVEMRHIFEDLAQTVGKINRLLQSVTYPDLPPYNPNEKKPEDKKPDDKKIGQAAPGGAPLVQSTPTGILGNPASASGPFIEPVSPPAPASSPDTAARPAVLEGPIKMTPQETGPIQVLPPVDAPGIQGAPAAGGQPGPNQKPKVEDLPPPKKLGGEGPAVPLERALDLARGALVAGLSDRDPRVRLASVDALETMGEAAAPTVPALVRALQDSDRFVRWAASRTLGKLAPRRPDLAVPVLAGMMQPDEDLSVRLSVANTLSLFGPTAGAAVPALTRSLAARDSEIRVATLKTLESIGTEAASALPDMTRRLRDVNPQVRAEAARVLARFGPLAVDSLPALRRALFDTNDDVRRAASDAILSIDVKAEKK